jgi:glutamate dehydrogenase (NAD(P)+)
VPHRAPHLSVTWADAETDARGHVVIDSRIRGVAGGGLRMRPGLTLEEVGDLARAMTRKEALAFRPGARYVPLGGAKGGIDFDPYDPRALDVLRRFLEAVQPILRDRWAYGEDMGVRQDELDVVAAELGMRSTVDCVLRLVEDGADAGLARIDAAFAAQDRGIGLGELVGGYGVARAALGALDELGIKHAGARAVIQGFGSMGGATARYLADAGARVVALADIDGVVVSEAGLDVERLLRTRDRHGRMDRAELGAGVTVLERDAWARVPCDVLVPAAASYVIDGETAAAIDARVVVEAANVATLPGAERALAERGIPVVPDFMANLATNAWWWWTLFGDIPPERDPALRKVATTMRRLVGELLERSAAERILPRAAATAIADENLERLAASNTTVS